MVSKTRLSEQVRRFASGEVAEGLRENPELLAHRDDRGRNWLHLCASVCIEKKQSLDPEDSVRLAEPLLDLGIGIDEPAFTEGSWQATPLWYAVARGHNLLLATFLLDRGCSPEHCLWAAAFRENGEMLALLLERGASIEAVAEGETPLLGAVKMSRFGKVGMLLDAGADPDYRDAGGMTALHYMLKKSSDREYVELFVEHGARGDIPDPDDKTVIEIMRRKRDTRYHSLASRLKSAL